MKPFSRRNAEASAPAPNYNNPTVPDAQTYKNPPAPAAQNYNQAPVPAAQNYNQDPIPSAKNYHTTPIPDSQNHKDEHRHSSKTSGDSLLTNQILASDRSHARPDDDVTLLPLKNILQTVDVILSRITRPDIHDIVTGAPVASAHADALEHEKTLHATTSSLHDNYDGPTSLFNAISSEIFRNWLSGEDAHKTAMDVLDIVKHYYWDEKVVLALGTFAVKYGEYWLVAYLYPTNPLAKAVGQLKQVHKLLERAGTSLKPKFDAYNNLVRAVLNVTKCIVQLHELHRDPHLTTEAELADNSDNLVRAVHNALIPTAVYWTIRSIVVAALQPLGITGMGSEYVIETWELLTLAQKLDNIHSDLKETLDRLHDIIHDIIQRKQDDEALANIANILEKSHIDNTKSLRVLFSNGDRPALYDCHKKNDVVNIEVLKLKVMILFLSDLDVVHKNEYMIVQQMYMEKQQNPTRTVSQYEVVWIPIVDTLTGVEYQQFEELRRNMEWYTVVKPSVVSQTVIRYIRKQDKWNYAEKPLLVVMDHDGKIVNTNAVLMMCVWGNNAFPFTSDRERVPWEEKTHWTMDLLADAIDPNLITWIQKKKYICLYGGVDINWIRNFTRLAKDVARAAGIQLELLYVGKREPDDAVREIINFIKTEDLSHTLEPDFIRFFWVRLESMWQSKGQLMKPEDFRSRIFWNANMKNDVVMQGIISVLTFGSSNLVWAVIDDGLSAMAKASGEDMHTSLKEFNLWNKRATALGFVPALKERLARGHKETPHPCPHHWLPPIELMAGITVRAQCCPNMVKISVHKEID